jgi:hypothetical protein
MIGIAGMIRSIAIAATLGALVAGVAAAGLGASIMREHSVKSTPLGLHGRQACLHRCVTQSYGIALALLGQIDDPLGNG